MAAKPDQPYSSGFSLSAPKDVSAAATSGPTDSKPLLGDVQKLSNKVDAAQIPAQQNNAQTELDNYHKEFNKKTLNIISQKWNDQLRRNKEEFDKGANQLQEYELKLIRQIKAVEQVQN
jgi:chromosome segregation ATPase